MQIDTDAIRRGWMSDIIAIIVTYYQITMQVGMKVSSLLPDTLHSQYWLIEMVVECYYPVF